MPEQKPAIWLRLALLLPLPVLSGCAGTPTHIFEHAYFDGQQCSTEKKDYTSAKTPEKPIICEAPTQPKDPAPLTKMTVTITGSNITYAPTPAAPPPPKAGKDAPVSPPRAVLVCPDAGAPPNNSGSGTPPFRACEARVIKAAMDYCNANVLREDGDFTKANFGAGAAGILLGTAAGLVTAAAGAKPATAALVAGVVTVLGAADGSAAKLLQPPGTVKQADMISAAQQYLTVAGPVPDNPCEAEDYYAALFNAVGTACPAASFNKLHTLNDEIKGGHTSFADAKGKWCLPPAPGKLKFP